MRKSDLFQVGVEYMTPRGKAEVHHFVFDPTDSITLKYIVMKGPSGNMFNVKPEDLNRITKRMNENNLRKEIRKIISEIKSDVVSDGLTVYDDGSVTGTKGIALDIVKVDDEYVYMICPEKKKFKLTRKDFDKRKLNVTN